MKTWISAINPEKHGMLCKIDMKCIDEIFEVFSLRNIIPKLLNHFKILFLKLVNFGPSTSESFSL